MHRLITFFICLIAATSLASASTIKFTGAATTVSDGTYYVLPYQLTIDGVSQLVDCYDVLDEVKSGDTWQANILNIASGAASGFFSAPNELADYERIAWLSAQTYSGTAQQIGLQHAIWNVFGSVSDNAQSTTYENAATAAAAKGYAGFDFSSYRFIQEVGAVAGAAGTEQAFVYQATGVTPPSGQSPSATPEPGTVTLLICAAAVLACARACSKVS